MKTFRKYKFEILLILGISALYFLLRVPNLTLQPIFADEAIYIRWAQVMKAEPTLRFLPLSDGKTPLFMWMMIPFFKIFDDPLFAGRFLSVLSGFGTLLGALFLGWKFFNKRVGIWAAFLISLTPFIVFFDRMALVDSMLSFFSIWSIIFALLLVKYPRFDIAMVLGYLLGASLLTKPPGFFNIIAIPTTLLIFKWFDKFRQINFLKLFGLWLVAIIITLGIYNILRLGSGFVNLNSRNQDYVRSPEAILSNPLDPLIPHAYDLLDWFLKLLTVPLFLILIISLILLILKRNKLGLVIFLWSFIPLLIQTEFLKTYTARYVLFSIPPLLVLTAWGIDQLILLLKYKNFLLKTCGFLIFVSVLPLIFCFQLLTNPVNLNLPRNERQGYFEEWTAGYGFKELASFFAERAKSELIVVGTEGSFGTLPDGLQIYLDSNRQVVIIGGKSIISKQLRDTALEHPTYFVANRKENTEAPAGTKLIKTYIKPLGNNKLVSESILIYEVYPILESTPSASEAN